MTTSAIDIRCAKMILNIWPLPILRPAMNDFLRRSIDGALAIADIYAFAITAVN